MDRENMKKLEGILLSKLLCGRKVVQPYFGGIVARNPRNVVVVGKEQRKSDRERKNMREVGRKGEVAI